MILGPDGLPIAGSANATVGGMMRNVGARQAAMYGEKLSAKSYVQQGLVALFDGIENSGFGVHLDNITTWVNLVDDSKSASVNNSLISTAENCLIHNRNSYSGCYVNSYFDIVSAESVSSFGEDGAIYTFSQSLNGGNSSFGKNHILANLSGSIGIGTSKSENSTYYGSTINLQKGVPYNFHSQYSGNITSRIFHNGNELIFSHNSIPYSNFNGKFTMFGRSYNDNQGRDGRIYSVRIYNRNLSTDEIRHNYIVDKVRFNLP